MNQTPNPSGAEPLPGQWLLPEDFSSVVRLTPLVAIDLVLRSPASCILVGLRSHEPARGFYFVPGGRIAKNETLDAAFTRIAHAELGVTLKRSDARLLGVYEHFYQTNRLQALGFGTHYVVLAYQLGMDLDISSLPTDQHNEFRWMNIPDLLAAPDVHDNTKAYFPRASPSR